MTSPSAAPELVWSIPSPTTAQLTGLRGAWLALLALAVAWLVSLVVDVVLGRASGWSLLGAALVVLAWAWFTRPPVLAVARWPVLTLAWRVADRGHVAGWTDPSGATVSVDVLLDLGWGLLIRHDGPGGVQHRWVSAASLGTDIRWRLFHAPQAMLASSSTPSPENTTLLSDKTRSPKARTRRAA